jgi:type VI protein secretion system component Hcp
MFLKVEGVDGDSMDGQHRNWSNVRGYLPAQRWNSGGTSNDAIGYGQGDGKTFLVTRDIKGEASFGTLQEPIGLLAFTRSLSGTETTKGTDIATLALLAALHQGWPQRQVTIHFGCGSSPNGPVCSQSIQLPVDPFVTELVYGASQVERVTWLEPTAGGPVKTP